MLLGATLSNDHAFVKGLLRCPPKDYLEIEFLIDTGCTTTTLSPDDVYLLGINCNHLKPTTEPVKTATGYAHPYVYPNPDLMFIVKDGWSKREILVEATLSEINCWEPRKPHLDEDHDYSALGMDFLKHFDKWNWNHKGKNLVLQGVLQNKRNH